MSTAIAPATPLLSVRGLSKRFSETVVLQEVSCSVFMGEILGLIGPNGAGKTTFFECLAGLMPADSGEVRYADDVLSAAERKRALFYVPDGIRPWSEQRAEDVVRFTAALNGRSIAEAATIFSALKLDHAARRKVWMLSKGEAKRLTLALGLLSKQPLLVVDEPFDGLDLRQTRDVMQLLRDHASQGRTIFVSIHQLNDAAKVCDRLVLLSGGRKVGEGTLEELRQQAGLSADASNAGLEEVFLALT